MNFPAPSIKSSGNGIIATLEALTSAHTRRGEERGKWRETLALGEAKKCPRVGTHAIVVNTKIHACEYISSGPAFVT